ncbi:MAG: hypothetical protein OXC80_01310 [Gammaproteobacteria bacterium]|nr:hypothetical protein [Gammaproteobacteria bacterium]
MSADGTWNVTATSPMGSQNATLTFKTDGSSLSGSMSGQQGTTEISGGSVDGNDLKWSVALTQPMPITLEFTASVDGDSISGNFKIGAFGSGTLSGTRAS